MLEGTVTSDGQSQEKLFVGLQQNTYTVAFRTLPRQNALSRFTNSLKTFAAC
jgi:hypothetical protein